MIRLGVISNPNSRRNLTDPAVARRLASRPDIPCFRYTGTEDLAGALADFARRGITDLIVDGGDGTVVAAVSAALRAPGLPELPRLALIPSGMTNLIARELGIGGPREGMLDRLLAAEPREIEAATVERAPMHVARRGLPDLHGFLLGAAAFHRGTLFSWERVHPLGATQDAAAGLGILANLWRALFGADRRAFLAGDPMGLAVDGRQVAGERRFLFLASMLDRLVLGIRPFWGTGTGEIRWLDVLAPPRRLIAALPRVLIGRPARWMYSAGYNSGLANVLQVRSHRPFVLDGEIVEPGPDGEFRIGPGRPVRFIRLA